jgi:hypothetical protein
MNKRILSFAATYLLVVVYGHGATYGAEANDNNPKDQNHHITTVLAKKESLVDQASDIKPAVQAALTDKEYLEVFSMYVQMQERYQTERDRFGRLKVGANTLNEQQQCSFEDPLTLVKSLTITLPLEEMRRVFETYGVLQLRPFNGIMALIGCGNNPIEKPYIPLDDYELDKSKPIPRAALFVLCEYFECSGSSLGDHRHEGYDTINPELTMNPTLVAAFGIDKLEGVLPNTYIKVSYENIFPGGDPESLNAFKFHFSNADVYDMHPNQEDFRFNVEIPYANIEVMLEEIEREYKLNEEKKLEGDAGRF